MKNYSYCLLIAMSLFFVRCGELETQTDSTEPALTSSISPTNTNLIPQTEEPEYFSCFIGFISNEYIKNMTVTYHVDWEGRDDYGTLIPNGEMFLTETMSERAVETLLTDDIFATCRYITVGFERVYLPDLPVSEWYYKEVNVHITQTTEGKWYQNVTLFNGTATINKVGEQAYIDISAPADFYRLPNGTFDGQLGFYYTVNIELPE